MAYIDSGANAGFVPEIFLATALGRLKSYLTLQRTVTMDSDLQNGESFSVGKILHLPKRGTLTVNQKTETGNVTLQNPQSSTVDVVLNHHPEVSFALTSEAIAFQNQDTSQGYINDAIIALAEDIDQSLMQAYLLISGSNTITASTNISEANILTARQTLRTNKVIPTAKMYGVVSMAQEAQILQLTNTVRYDALGVSNNVSNATVGDGVITMPGAIGRTYGFEICPSQLVPVVSGTGHGLQTLTVGGSPTGGSFTLTYNSVTSAPIPYNASAATVQDIIDDIVGEGLSYVSGNAGGPWTVALLLPNGTTPLAFTHTDSFTGGSSPALTVADASVTNGARNLFYTSDFLLMASRALPLPAVGEGAIGSIMTDPDTGITMRLVKSWNPNVMAEQITLDLLYGFGAMRSEHGVCIISSN